MDSYNYFDDQKIGFSISVILPCGTYDFTKISEHQYCVVNYAKNCEPFVYSKLSTVLTTIEASNLYDTLKKFER